MTAKKRLGKGLGALIPEHLEESPFIVKQVPLHKIKPNPYQPRTIFNEEKIRELADSIKEHGVIQPVILSAEGDEFVLIAGERRFKACQLAGVTEIPALVKAVSPKETLEIALIENLQREDLNPMEEAAAYRILMKEFAITQEELSKRLGKSRSAITNTLRLLYLEKEVQQAILSGKITAGQARPLLAVKDEGLQQELAARIIQQNLSAREVETAVSRIVAPNKQKQPPDTFRSSRIEVDTLFRNELKEKLQQRLGTKVRIYNKKTKEGSVEIDFFGDSDLERLAQIILGEDRIT